MAVVEWIHDFRLRCLPTESSLGVHFQFAKDTFGFRGVGK